MVRAAKLQKRAASVGFDWPDIKAVIKKMYEELDELDQVLTDTPQDKERLQDEIGDILFVASNLARKAGLIQKQRYLAVTGNLNADFTILKSG